MNFKHFWFLDQQRGPLHLHLTKQKNYVPQVNQVAQVAFQFVFFSWGLRWRIRIRISISWGSTGITIICGQWHIHGALSQERAMIGRHVAQVIHDHEHFHHRIVRIEQCDLNGATIGHFITAFAQCAQIYNTLLRRSQIKQNYT